MLFEQREESIDIMGIGVRNLPGYEHCLERFFCCLLGLKAEVFIQDS